MNYAREQEEKRALTVDDISKIKTIEEARISPKGGNVAFTVQSINLKQNRYETDIYLVPTSGSEVKRLTEDGRSGLPTWSPNGERIAFVNNVEGVRSIFLMDIKGENRRKIAEYDLSNASLGMLTVGESIRWSPDGSMIVFLASIGRVDKEAKIKVIHRLMYKSFYGYSDMRRRHLFIVSTLGHEPPRQLTFGDFDEHSFCWSPDSREIAFISNRSGFDDFNMQTDIWSVNVENGEIRRITDTKGAIYHPQWSPDGSRIVCVATTRPDTSNESTPEDRHVWVVDSDGGRMEDVTRSLDRTSDYPPSWTPDGDRILFTAYDRGRVPLFSVEWKKGKISQVMGGDRWVSKVDVAKKAVIMVFVSSNPLSPGELYSSDLEGRDMLCLTDINSFLENVHLSKPEEFQFHSFDGTQIQGWLYKPSDFDASKKYLPLLNIKGGPSGMRGYGFNTYMQLGPAHGYVQFCINYRGSSGYGQSFSDAVVRDMLGGEFMDNMEAVGYIIRTKSYVDSECLGVWGGSYGGYLTNWIVTQTDRFKAAVSISSISNLFSQWGTSAIPSWVEVEVGGLPWDHLDLMIKQSPIMEANKVKTPVLFLHGELDFDTPIVEAEQMFMALKKDRVETVMVRYLDDGHGIRKKPVNYIDVLRRVVAWFEVHLMKQVSTP